MARGHFNLEKTRRPIPFSNFAERYREFASGYKREWYEEKYIVEEHFCKNCSAILPWRRSLLGRSRSGNQTKQKWYSRRQSTDAFTVMKHMFKKALDWGLTKSNPATGVKRLRVTSERTRFLTGDQVQTLLKTCKADVASPWLHPLVILALNTGMRQGELLGLKWNDVSFERGVITVMQTKTLRLKVIAINEASREALNWLQANRYGDKLFLWPWGDAVGKTTVYDAFKRACKASGIENFHFHDLVGRPSLLTLSWPGLIWSR